MKLSRTTQEAFKTALAMTIAYGIGLYMNWDRPYWAGFAVAFISLDTMGQSLNKGAMRFAGTIVGAVVALTLVGLFAQQRWLFILFASLWLGLCTYMNMGPRNQYAWFVAGFVSLIIAIDGGPDPANVFSIAMLRIQQTCLGIVVYGLVSTLLWPKNSQDSLENTALELLDSQQQLFRSGLQVLRGSNEQEVLHSLHAREVAALTSLSGQLEAALVDSDQIRANRQHWQAYRSLVNRLGTAIQRCQENVTDLRSLPLERLLPGLDSLVLEIDSRFDVMTRLLRRQATEPCCREVTLEINETALSEVSHFQRAALLLTQRYLIEIDTISREMMDTIHNIRTFAATGGASLPGAPQPLPFTLDSDRLVAAGKMVLTIWLAFLAPIYIGDFPGGISFATMCGSFGMILISNQQIPVQVLIRPIAQSILFAGALYVFLMPQLSSFTGLGLMIFASTFGICYRYAAPHKAINRAVSLALFVIIISVSNQQSYSFLSIADTALTLALVFSLLTLISYIPFRPLAERTLLRMLKRYFRSAAQILAEQLPPAGAPPTRRVCFHQRELDSLPSKMQLWLGQLDPDILGEASVQEMPALLGKLHVLRYRMHALQEARALPQAEQLLVLRVDMQDWRKKLREAFLRLTADPGDHANLQRARLDRLLGELETRVADTLNADGAEAINDLQRENLYALLGSYRGVSEALLDLVESLGSIEWQPWYQERFA